MENPYELLLDEQLIEKGEGALEYAPRTNAELFDKVAILQAYAKLLKIHLEREKRNGLFAQLQRIPEYKAFQNAVEEKLTCENGYVKHFMPNKSYLEEEDDETGRRYFMHMMKDCDREEKAIEALIDDKTGYFDDFIHDELLNEVTELCRALISKMRGL